MNLVLAEVVRSISIVVENKKVLQHFGRQQTWMRYGKCAGHHLARGGKSRGMYSSGPNTQEMLAKVVGLDRSVISRNVPA